MDSDELSPSSTSGSLPPTPGKSIEHLLRRPTPEERIDDWWRTRNDGRVEPLRRKLVHLNLEHEVVDSITLEDSPPASPITDEPLEEIALTPPSVPGPSGSSGEVFSDPGNSARKITILEDLLLVPGTAPESRTESLQITILDDEDPTKTEVILVPWEALRKSKRRKQRFTTTGGNRVNVKLLKDGQIKVTNRKAF